ncbi:WapI family immunity protein [Glaciecola sp. 2405UD65-10]|uniref:WapI family immunity protein n=1 Tax=Glaciecola sp. 2405UD65-10 TaxID=3397244 RepID=UPI003B5C5EB2
MIFTGIENETLEFKIVGYEIPENQGPSYEANFLYIELDVKSVHRNWHTDNCALSTTDVEKIIDWFYRLQQNNIVIRDLEFIEKGISFEYLQQTNSQVQFRILLHSDCTPNDMKNFHINFKLNEKELKVVHESLQKELSAFPTRGFEK